MANRRIHGNDYRGVIIDTAPGANGYWTEGVNAQDHDVPELLFSISGIFSGTVTLQYKDKLGTWTNYDTYTEVTRQIIEDYTETEWRAGVASGNYTSGAARIVLDYYRGESK